MWLLIVFIVSMTLSSVFNLDPGLAPGLSAKNAILYLLALGIVARIAMDRGFKFELRGLHVVFGLLIFYAIASYAMVVMVIDYPHYDAWDGALTLKTLIDQLLIFAVFFYVLRTTSDAAVVLKWLAASFAISHVMAILGAIGLVQIGGIELRSDGRVQGLVGESNQYGAFVAMSLPAIVSLAAISRGMWRMLWGVMAFVTAATLLMTVSRGAFVATAIAGMCAFLLLRRYLRPGGIALWIVISVFGIVAVLVAAIALGYGELLYERVLQDSKGGMESSSSGRTKIWASAIGMMMDKPLTLITGYGWRSYWVMPFRYSPHNYYVNLWFNLGVVGLASAILLFAIPLRRALASLASADATSRWILIGFIVSTVAYAVATFFVDLYVPWTYFWAYAGISMRVAMNVVAPQPPKQASAAVAREPRAQYGWLGGARHAVRH
jgi:O-antigen ligase